MNKIIWSDRYNLGIDNIDEQHKKIIHIINNIFDITNTINKDKIIGNMLLELINYAHEHFTLEEQIMTEHKYPNLTKHLIMHKYFIERIKFFSKEYLYNNDIINELLLFLQVWFTDHILIMDKEYTIFIEKTTK